MLPYRRHLLLLWLAESVVDVGCLAYDRVMFTRPPSLIALVAFLLWPATTFASSIDMWCEQLGKRLRSVSKDACRTQHFVVARDLTPKGNPLVFLDIAAANRPERTLPTRRILVVGGIHGDELTSISTVFRWLNWIRQPNAAIHHWRLIPLANPDGLMARRPTRVNANGVDLNRNFQTPDWARDAQAYWINRTQRDPRRNPGKQAGSEIETLWLQAQVEEFRPDLIISVHAPYNLLDYDGPVPKPLRFGRLTLNQLGVYPGSMGNFFGLFKQIPLVTIELPNATTMPSQKDQKEMWRDMLKWIRNNRG